MAIYKDYRLGKTKDFYLYPCKETDLGEVMNFLEKNLLLPSNSRYLRKDFVLFLVARALRNHFSLKVLDCTNRRMVALRLCSAAHRDHTLNERTTFLFDERERFVNLGKYETGPGEFWTQAEPDIKKVLKVELMFSLPEYRTRVEKHLARFNLSKNKLREDGYAGILSENSFEVGRILKANGKYRQLAVISTYDYLENTIVWVPLQFKDIRL